MRWQRQHRASRLPRDSRGRWVAPNSRQAMEIEFDSFRANCRAIEAEQEQERRADEAYQDRLDQEAIEAHQKFCREHPRIKRALDIGLGLVCAYLVIYTLIQIVGGAW